MHEVGSIIVLRIVNQQSAIARVQIDDDTFEYLCHEAHQEFGELLADAWKLPPQLKAIISDHHQYPAPEDPLRMERLQLRVCDMICGLLGYAPYAPYALLDSRAVQELGLSQREDFRAFLAGLPDGIMDAFEAAM
jgi:HD-like signal output (HDOD) protein